MAGVTAPGYRLRIELDENQIPNLDAARIILVHKDATRMAVWRQIDVHFRARPARAGVAHHPEIVGFPAAENVNFWIEIGFAKQMSPMIVGFLIELTRLVRPGLINRRIKPFGRKFPAFDQ